jgi:hypothetical protein
MNEILDLLLIPGERDFPAGQMAARRDAIVAAVAAEQQQRHSLRAAVRAARRHITRTWLALLAASLSGYQSRVSTTSEVLLAAAGSAQIVAVIASPSALRSVELGRRRILLPCVPAAACAR